MKWDEIAKIAIAVLLSASGGSYFTHSHDVAEQDKNTLSCSEVIQLVIDNQKD